MFGCQPRFLRPMPKFSVLLTILSEEVYLNQICFESTTTRTAGGLDFSAIGGKRQGREVPQSLRVKPGAKHPVWKTQLNLLFVFEVQNPCVRPTEFSFEGWRMLNPNLNFPKHFLTRTSRNKLPQRHQDTKRNLWLIFIFASLCLGGVNILLQNAQK